MHLKDEPESVYSNIEGDYLTIVASNNQEYYDYRNRCRHEPHHMESMKIEVPNEATGKRCCKLPPWWGWLLLVIGLAILGSLIALSVWLFTSNLITCPPTSLVQTKGDLPLTSDGGTVIVECMSGATFRGGVKKFVASCHLGHWDVTGSCVFVDCKGAHDNGHGTSGVYRISPDGNTNFNVYCEQRINSGGWTVIQRRCYGNVSFFRNWAEYKDGFGDLTGDFWLGNDYIHILTAGRHQKLKIDMKHPNKTSAQADYSDFYVEDEGNFYRLHVSGFVSANLPSDSFTQHSGETFSTKDRANNAYNKSCAASFYGGWWYMNSGCYYSNLNGLYNSNTTRGVRWNKFTTEDESLINVQMMIKGV